jgi:K+:H+ antiporter
LGVLRQLAIASVVLGAAAVASRPVFRMALSWVARAKSTDLFLLSVLLLTLGTAFAARHAGIASPIGAFLAGMVIGESDFRHQVEDDIRPFRDVLWAFSLSLSVWR